LIGVIRHRIFSRRRCRLVLWSSLTTELLCQHGGLQLGSLLPSLFRQLLQRLLSLLLCCLGGGGILLLQRFRSSLSLCRCIHLGKRIGPLRQLGSGPRQISLRLLLIGQILPLLSCLSRSLSQFALPLSQSVGLPGQFFELPGLFLSLGRSKSWLLRGWWRERLGSLVEFLGQLLQGLLCFGDGVPGCIGLSRIGSCLAQHVRCLPGRIPGLLLCGTGSRCRELFSCLGQLRLLISLLAEPLGLLGWVLQRFSRLL
jgi:hypothetical protein